MNGLKGKRVVVTGGAAGIGRATAQRFLAEGAEVLVADMVAWDGDGLSDEEKGRMTSIVCDVTTEDGLAAVDAWADAGIDVLVNNAGVTRDSVSWKIEPDAWQKVIDVNLTAVFRLAQLAARRMRAQKRGGVILNAASVVAHYGNFGQANYVASKAGVVGLTKTMAKELGRAGIRVNAVAPGFVMTDMVAKVPDEVLAGMREKTPLSRLGKPEEIAGLYAFLASDDAAFITGAVINIDGGLVT